MAWQKVRIPIPEGIDKETRLNIGEDIIEAILARCASGYGVTESGRRYKLPGYSKSYAEFKGTNQVDLRLSSEMLEDLKVLSTSKSSILIGFENGTETNARAEGNQLGSYGGSPNSKKARRFLGVTKDELEAILSEYGEY